MNGDLTVKILYLNAGFADPLTLFGSYHIYDYNLLANIRLNSLLRAAAFGSHR